MQIAVNTPRTYNLMDVSEEVLQKYPALWSQVQSANGAENKSHKATTLQKNRAKAAPRAAKRAAAPKMTKLVKTTMGRGHSTNMMKCPFGNEEIKTQGWQNHVRSEAGKAGWAGQDIENLILDTTAKRNKKD